MKNKFLTIDGVTYKKVAPVADGGNSIVWEARSSADGKSYAVKRIEKSDADHNKRFEREIDFGAHATHPNVVKIHGSTEDEKYFYYVMDLYSASLRRIIADEYDPDVLLEYLSQLCDAVEYVHSEEVVHRDIKPENILIDADRQHLVLADFGIAHFKDSTLTTQTSLLANRNYLAPEQMQGQDARDVNAPADVFAVGLIINEAFTKDYARGFEHQRVSDVQPHLSALDDLVDLMMLQDPTQRITINAAHDWLRAIMMSTEAEDIQENLQDASSPSALPANTEDIFKIAVRDVVAAQQIFERVPEARLRRYNSNYHCEISYTATDELFNTCVLFEIYNTCKRKFDNETPAEFDDAGQSVAQPIATADQLDALHAILREYALPAGARWGFLGRRAVHYFSFCKDYHCAELLQTIRALVPNPEAGDKGAMRERLAGAPILWLTQAARGYLQLDGTSLTEDDRRDIRFGLNVIVDWSATDVEDAHRAQVGADLFDDQSVAAPIAKVLDRLAQDWDVSYARRAAQTFVVFFRSEQEFDRFRIHAEGVAPEGSLLEADVHDLLRLAEHHGSLVALNWDSVFDIPNTLAKVLGLRKV
ncbi:protein kinase [Curtobacterium sp. AB7]|uniref:serine/threonine-protein kinase n=1 Tax=Curtobacterium sp. AB7 TaxID=3349327 RepID=UPI003839BDED